MVEAKWKRELKEILTKQGFTEKDINILLKLANENNYTYFKLQSLVTTMYELRQMIEVS